MSQDPYASIDQQALEMIEHSPVGALPHTPTYQDALRRLYASHQVYASADHKAGHVTVRSLARLPEFHATNLEEFVAGRIASEALESNASIFDRYVASLPSEARVRATEQRLKVVGRPVHHRHHHHAAGEAPAIHDPVHSLFLIPGTGPHHGLPGNYLYGSLFEVTHAGAAPGWALQLHDVQDGASTFDAATLAEVGEKFQEMLASAPFHLSELETLGFRTK